MKRLVSIGAACALSCAARAPRGPEQGAAPGALTVSLEVQGLRQGAVRTAPLLQGGALRSGDSFTLRAEADRPAYLYVLRYAPAGWSTLLFPGPEEALLQARRPVLLPAEGARRYVLDKEAGEELLYVVAAPRPLRAADPALCRRLRLRCDEAGARRGDDDPPPPPPEGLPPDKRGDELPGDRGEGRVRVRADGSGVAVLRFGFRHDP